MTILCSPKVTQHHNQVTGPLPPGKSFFARGQITREPGLATPQWLIVLMGRQISFRKLSSLRGCGADDGTAARTPSAWMISPAAFLALRQIVFLVWVTLTEHKWVILAERRGPPSEAGLTRLRNWECRASSGSKELGG